MTLRAPAPPRSPWQKFYGLAHRLRGRYWAGKARALPRPVLSVGNLHWGGSGKTPLTAAIARHLVSPEGGGHRVAILSRGYGRASDDDQVVIVSHGDGPLLGPRQAGDEPVLLATEAPGAAVVVCADRWRAGSHAMERLDPAPDLFLLDDGFSHLKLRRDLDLLVFPAADPFAGGRLPPGGRLREPLAAAARAQAVLFSGPEPAADAGDQLARALRPHGFAGPGFTVRSVIDEPRPVASAAGPVVGPFLVVSAIARPQNFLHSVHRAGLEIAGELAFRDHHAYPASSLERIRREMEARGARALAVTSKDRVKLQGRLEVPMVEVPLRAEPEAAFWRWLDERLRALRSLEAR